MSFTKRAKRVSAFAVVIGLATGLSACGDGNEDRSRLLSSNRASDLRSSLGEVEQMIDDGNCTGATNAVLAFEQKVNALPKRVDGNLRDALASGAVRLQRLVEDQCEPVGPTGPTVQPPAAPQEEEGEGENGQGKKGKGKAKGQEKNQGEEGLEEGSTTVPADPDANTGGTTAP